MFKRKILSKLEAWKQDERHKPLILRGARQVGKTTVVNEFGSQFDNYLYFNLEMSESVRLFEMDIPLNDLVNMLFASLGKLQKEGSTLIFIDEIQNSSKTIALLRYFYEQRPDLYVIAAGSLLENLVDINVSFPVGRVMYLALRPCSFFEFLGAIGKNNLLTILSQKAEYTIAFHKQLMHQFNQYTIIGGMPEAVQHYAETEQITAQELLSMEDRVGQHRSFWAKPNNGAKVDFLFIHNSKLYPIEVKSGTNAHLRSLQVFMDNSDIDIAIRVWSNPYSVNIVKTPKGKVFRLINLPFYLIGNLHQILDEVI